MCKIEITIQLEEAEEMLENLELPDDIKSKVIEQIDGWILTRDLNIEVD